MKGEEKIKIKRQTDRWSDTNRHSDRQTDRRAKRHVNRQEIVLTDRQQSFTQTSNHRYIDGAQTPAD